MTDRDQHPMSAISRRQLALSALAFGASFVACRATPRPTTHPAATERRDLFPEGVASGDPDPESVILWTRRPYDDGRASARLHLEVAEDLAFARVVASTEAPISAASDWTCRVLVGGLRPARTYFYRFTDDRGFASRLGRTRTAPALDDPRTARFAFVSCQNVSEGAQNAFRRMIFEDARAPENDQLDFVLHLGDFIYEVINYPEDSPNGKRYDRRLREVLRYTRAEKIGDFHIPVDLSGYREAYRAYLRDPDIQDARARWPFVAIWDNHEFSWLGWQSFQVFHGETRPAATRKVAANQAWFEYQPARVRQPSGSLERFLAPRVKDTDNQAAIDSLTAYRALRWGKNVDLIITDQRSYRSEDPKLPDAVEVATKNFPNMVPEEAVRDLPPQTILGAVQKAWFKERLKSSTATWKVWASTQGTLDGRMDPQNLPEGLTTRWPGAGYANSGNGDMSGALVERAEIYDHVAKNGVRGFATVAGDRHSFWAGLAAKALPPAAFEPVGVAFITGSISAPGMVEALEHKLPKDHPLRALYLTDRGARTEPAVNLLMMHGVKTCLEYQRTGDLARAKALSNAALAPHLAFLDMGGHGYAVVRASPDAFECELVCIPRPLERSDRDDGGPLLYRVVFRAPLWSEGASPRLESRVVEGDPALSLR